MPRVVLHASLILAGVIAGTAFTAYAADPVSKAPVTKAKPTPAPTPVASSGVEPVEYRFMVLSTSSAPTAEHEKQLNALGADGWRVVAPIYSGGILNSYLMTRTRQSK